jgi:outer membrane protein OmpA-like peptidoglycan-associated protein
MTIMAKLKYIFFIFISVFSQVKTQAQKDKKSTQNASNADKIKINNMRLVNSAALDFSPAFYKDDLVFVSNNTINGKKKVFDKNIKQASMSLFITKKDRSGYYRKPEAFDSTFISTVHEGPITYDAQNDVIYFTRNDTKPGGKKPRYVNSTNYMRIYSSVFDSENWSTPELAPFNDEKSDACHPTISADGEKLYFASNRAGGFGGMDLYMCKMVEGAWSEAVNLGSEVNSSKNEVFPFIHEDGTLYFSSNKAKGLGGLDVYYTRIDNTGNYLKPISMGKPFNTDKDDFGFIVNPENKMGFLASNRAGGLGGDDIYSFNIPEGTKPFSDVKQLSEAYKEEAKTTLSDKDNSKDSDAKRVVNIYVIDRKSGLPLSKSYICIASTGNQKPSVETGGDNCETITTDENGKAVLHINANSNYFVRINKTDFKPNTMTVIKNDNRNESIILLDKIGESANNNNSEMAENSSTNGNNATKSNRIYKLSNIYYDYDDASIRPDARRSLDSLIQILYDFPEMEIELAAHTDSRGNVPYNINLSKRRANSVIEYLVSNGIKRRRLNAVGYGKKQLSNECGDGTPCPPEKHQENRRTEVRVIKSGGSEGKIVPQNPRK